MLCTGADISQNDDIEKLASTRASIYRKCRLENIDLPLIAGSLSSVPMEDVSNVVYS